MLWGQGPTWTGLVRPWDPKNLALNLGSMFYSQSDLELLSPISPRFHLCKMGRKTPTCMCGMTIRNHTRGVIGVNADVPRVMLSVLSSLWRTLTLLNLHEHSMM